MPNQLLSFFKKPKTAQRTIIIVSGLPRSGTSMMIKMLEAGGIEPMTDHQRAADENNPNGYYEYEPVKKLKEGDTAWMESAVGKSVKVISALLQSLPPTYFYRVIFMQRNLDEVLASQKKMLIDRGEPTDKVSDEQMAALFRKHLQNIETWLSEQPNLEVLYIPYNEILNNPGEFLERINKFLGGNLNVEAMAKTIDPNLYRQRKA